MLMYSEILYHRGRVLPATKELHAKESKNDNEEEEEEDEGDDGLHGVHQGDNQVS